MAVRFDASGDLLKRDASLPTRTAFTVMGWFKITTDRNDYSTFIALDRIGDATDERSTKRASTAFQRKSTRTRRTMAQC